MQGVPGTRPLPKTLRVGGGNVLAAFSGHQTTVKSGGHSDAWPHGGFPGETHLVHARQVPPEQ